jgi:hypothetical protein
MIHDHNRDLYSLSTESEYIATLEAAKEAAWMKKFISDLKGDAEHRETY